jgi:arginase family enzyme
LFDALGDFGEVGNVPDYSDWISHLIDSGFNSRNIILISGRNFSSKDLEFIKENQIVWIKMDILREDISGVCDIVMERARKSSGFYVSVDFNCFDSAFAPASLEPCIGGLTSGNLIYFIKRLNLLKNFRGGDFVNLVAKKDFNNLSFDLAGRILFECLV